jgi:hypothetical protein
MNPTRSILIALVLVAVASTASAERLLVGDFSSAQPGGALPSGWRLAKLPAVRSTAFSVTRLDGTTAVQMDAQNAGASLYRPYSVDPGQTPVLEWRWRIENLIPGADLKTKRGDDAPARLYVMFDYPLDKLPFVERNKIRLARTVAGDLVPAAALCYVWDGSLPAGSSLWNAYSKRVRVIVAESGSARIGQWVSGRRDVAADFRAAFGEAPPRISGIAIAADTDQTGENVRSWIADIAFRKH